MDVSGAALGGRRWRMQTCTARTDFNAVVEAVDWLVEAEATSQVLRPAHTCTYNLLTSPRKSMVEPGTSTLMAVGPCFLRSRTAETLRDIMSGRHCASVEHTAAEVIGGAGSLGGDRRAPGLGHGAGHGATGACVGAGTGEFGDWWRGRGWGLFLMLGGEQHRAMNLRSRACVTVPNLRKFCWEIWSYSTLHSSKIHTRY